MHIFRYSQSEFMGMVMLMRRKKKGRMFGICLMISMILGMPVLVQAKDQTDPPKAEEIYARSAAVIDADSGRILYGKNEHEIRPMASTTKIMTCILALENMTEDQVVEVSETAVNQPKVRLGMRLGEKFYLRDLLYSLMLESHNDVAVAIAETVAGSVKAFSEKMNQKASEIGCEDTYFITPNGLDASDENGTHATTAADLASILRYCVMESPKRAEFLKITQTKQHTFSDLEGTSQYSCYNHNALLTMMDGALTGKTGFTADAGYCYVGAVKKEDRTFIVALLACGWPNNKGYKWKDMKTLISYADENFHYRSLGRKVDIPDIPVWNGVETRNPYETDVKIRLKIKGWDPDKKILLGKNEKLTVKTAWKEYLKAPVQKNQEAGKIEYRLNGEVIDKYQIVTAQTVDKRSYFLYLRLVFQRFSHNYE